MGRNHGLWNNNNNNDNNNNQDMNNTKIIIRTFVNIQNCYNKRTALFGAVYHNHLDCVDYLLDIGASMTVIDIDGNNIFDYAMEKGTFHVTQVLIVHAILHGCS